MANQKQKPFTITSIRSVARAVGSDHIYYVELTAQLKDGTVVDFESSEEFDTKEEAQDLAAKMRGAE